MYDVIIIGKGPAGLQAALYTARANLKTLLLGKVSVLSKSKRIDNYCCTEGKSGDELLATGESQAKAVGAEFKEEVVLSISKEEHFKVTTNEDLYEGKSIIIATGQPYKKIPIKNIDKFEGKGVHYCSTCDGFFYGDMKIGVLGYTDFAINEVKELLAFTKDITLFTNGKDLSITKENKEFLNENNIQVKNDLITSFEGEQFLERIVFKETSQEKLDGVFIAYGSASSLDFARKMGLIIEKNSLKADEKQKTNVEGLFAAGDCTGGFKQISTAVGQGALAGQSAISYVRNLQESD
jgi:thioredoxin reductase (NADPH)